MSYYAEGKGFIKFKHSLPYKKDMEVREIFGEDKAFYIEPYFSKADDFTVGTDGRYYSHGVAIEPDGLTISFDGRYTEEIEEMLNRVAEVADIDDGYIDFVGEEWGSFWRLVWGSDEWICQDGKVVYGFYDKGLFDE